jgi:hypothetical protein
MHELSTDKLVRKSGSRMAGYWKLLLHVGWVALVLSSASISSVAADGGAVQLRQLVRDVVNNELRANEDDHSHWMYRQRDVEPDKNVVQECVETKDGQICRVLERDGHVLSEQEQQQESAHIQQLIGDPSQLKKKQRQHQDDDHKAAEMIRMLPDGFLYEYDGEEGPNIRLRFQPNPNFDPPSREAMVFHCMAGTMLIDRQAKRLAEMNGKLVRNVDFGWGLLGRLAKGGTFQVRRRDVGEGHWQNTLVDVHIRGKALFFKTINADQHEVDDNFQRVPNNLTLSQGASMLQLPNLQAAKAGQ